MFVFTYDWCPEIPSTVRYPGYREALFCLDLDTGELQVKSRWMMR